MTPPWRGKMSTHMWREPWGGEEEGRGGETIYMSAQYTCTIAKSWKCKNILSTGNFFKGEIAIVFSKIFFYLHVYKNSNISLKHIHMYIHVNATSVVAAMLS